jgi:glucuronosyltransferase
MNNPVLRNQTVGIYHKITFCKHISLTGLQAPSPFIMQDFNPFQIISRLWVLGSVICEMYLMEPGVQELIHSKDENFDLIIIEAFFNECFLGFAHKFKAPVVQVCSFGGTAWMGDWIGNPNPYSYVPDGLKHYGDRMTFWERISNTVFGEFVRMGRKYYHLPKQDAIARKYFNYTDNLPSISELETSTVLLLVNNHFSLNYPKPLMPNLVQVGGLHIKQPQELPDVRSGKICLQIIVIYYWKLRN